MAQSRLGNGSGGMSANSGSTLEVLCAFTKLGLTSFGGPVAHIGYFRTEFVERGRMLDVMRVTATAGVDFDTCRQSVFCVSAVPVPMPKA